MSDGTRWRELIDDAERRDPLGHAAHLALGLLFLFAMPLGTAASNIISLPLLIVALLRVRSCGPIYARVLQWPPAWLAILLGAWSALSITWTSDAELAGRWLASMRLLILPLVIAPLLGRSALLAGALLAAITLQSIIQCGEYAVNRVAWNFDGLARFGGLTADPGKAALWNAVGVCGALAGALVLGGRWRLVMPVVALLCLGGVAASGTRRQLLALAVAIPALLAFVLLFVPERRLRALGVIAVLAASIGAAWPVIGPSIMTRVRQTNAQLDPQHDAAPIPGIVHYDLRGYYWRASMEAWRSAPLRGIGLGGTGDATVRASDRPAVAAWLREVLTREYPQWDEVKIEEELRRRIESRHPHSTWMQFLVETGLIGLLLALGTWCAAWASTLAPIWREARRRREPARVACPVPSTREDVPVDPIGLACAAGLLLWAVGAIFDASINSTSLGAAATLAALGGLAPRSRTGRP